jgi:hypothetical protein
MGAMRVGGIRLVSVLVLGVVLVLGGAPRADADEGAPVVVRITDAGAVTVSRAGKQLASASLKAGMREAQAKALHVVQRALKVLMQDAALREPIGTSKLRMRIDADRAARWEHIAWIMQAGAHLLG